MPKQLAFSKHLAAIGMPLRSIRQSWAAVSPDGSRMLFTVWQDEVNDGEYVIYPVTERRPGKIHPSANSKFGAKEARQMAEQAVSDKHIETLGVLCVADNTESHSRRRISYDEEHLLRLSLRRNSHGFLVATIGEPVLVQSAVSRTPQ